MNLKTCACGRTTHLPYYCRACWTALPIEAQREFYRRIQSGFSESKTGAVRMTAPYSNTTTSHAAAVAIEPHAGTLESRVLSYLRARAEFGATDEEIAYMLGMNPSTQRPRRLALWRKGLIEPKGERLTRSGRRAQVWVAVL